jgi:hypothetical protein
LRGQGHGSRLMDAAEALALQRGALAANLETHSFQGEDFYLKRGYVVFWPPGRLPTWPHQTISAKAAGCSTSHPSLHRSLPSRPRRAYRLLTSRIFILTIDGLRWTVPSGATSDGASIPKIFWSLVGGPLDGPYRNAAIIHDYFCDVRVRTWKDTHRVFLDGMLSNNVSRTTALQMYYAVYGFGPRWDFQAICDTRRSLITLLTPEIFGYYGMPRFEYKSYWTAPIREVSYRPIMIPSRPTSSPKIENDLATIKNHPLSLEQIEALAEGRSL